MTQDEFAQKFATSVADTAGYMILFNPVVEEWAWRGMRNQPDGAASAQSWIRAFMVSRLYDLNSKTNGEFNLYGVYPILEKILGDIWLKEIYDEVHQ